MNIINKTRKKFVMLMMSIISIIIIGGLGAIYYITYNTQETNNRQRLDSFEEVRITENGTVVFGEDSTEAYVVERTLSDRGINFSMLVDESGEVLANFSNIDFKNTDIFQEAVDIALKTESYSKVELEGRIWQYAKSTSLSSVIMDWGQQIENTGGIYQIRFIDITQSQQTLKDLAVTLCIMGTILLVFFFFFSLFFSDRAIKPLIEVLEKQQQFVADASHELKTPVSIIKANCSVLYFNKDSTVQSQIEWVDGISIGADRMNNLIKGLITMAKIEGHSKINISEVYISDEVDEYLYMFDLRIREKSLKIEKNADIILQSDQEKVKQVLGIVIDNAIKYVNFEGTIKISAEDSRKFINIEIFNTGEIIPQNDLEKIFNRFYQVEGSRSHDGSYGLGLSIAKSVMEQLNGEILVRSIEGSGTSFILRFPKKLK